VAKRMALPHCSERMKTAWLAALAAGWLFSVSAVPCSVSWVWTGPPCDAGVPLTASVLCTGATSRVRLLFVESEGKTVAFDPQPDLAVLLPGRRLVKGFLRLQWPPELPPPRRAQLHVAVCNPDLAECSQERHAFWVREWPLHAFRMSLAANFLPESNHPALRQMSDADVVLFPGSRMRVLTARPDAPRLAAMWQRSMSTPAMRHAHSHAPVVSGFGAWSSGGGRSPARVMQHLMMPPVPANTSVVLSTSEAVGIGDAFPLPHRAVTHSFRIGRCRVVMVDSGSFRPGLGRGQLEWVASQATVDEELGVFFLVVPVEWLSDHREEREWLFATLRGCGALRKTVVLSWGSNVGRVHWAWSGVPTIEAGSLDSLLAREAPWFAEDHLGGGIWVSVDVLDIGVHSLDKLRDGRHVVDPESGSGMCLHVRFHQSRPIAGQREQVVGAWHTCDPSVRAHLGEMRQASDAISLGVDATSMGVDESSWGGLPRDAETEEEEEGEKSQLFHLEAMRVVSSWVLRGVDRSWSALVGACRLVAVELDTLFSDPGQCLDLCLGPSVISMTEAGELPWGRRDADGTINGTCMWHWALSTPHRAFSLLLDCECVHPGVARLLLALGDIDSVSKMSWVLQGGRVADGAAATAALLVIALGCAVAIVGAGLLAADILRVMQSFTSRRHRRPLPRTSGVQRCVGLMSGTSRDGMDVAWLATDGKERVEFGPSLTVPYSPEQRSLLERAVKAAAVGYDALTSSAEGEAKAEVDRAADMLLEVQVSAVERLRSEGGGLEVDLVGSHGHTLHHDPRGLLSGTASTWQLNRAGRLADALGVPVVYDFRVNDVIHGGEGAPLVPVFHAVLATKAVSEGSLEYPVVVLNVGGVSNATVVREGAVSLVRGEDAADASCLQAMDTGPGNAPVDDFLRALDRSSDEWDDATLRALRAGMDVDGALGSSGEVVEELMERWRGRDSFRARAGPKSLDRDEYAWVVSDSMERVASTPVRDIVATIEAFVADCIASNIRGCCEHPATLVVCGGGARNDCLMAHLSRFLPGCSVVSADQVGWSTDGMEAQAFAYLAVRSQSRLPLSFPGTTGVDHAVTGGVLATPLIPTH
jgi:anhydro-N-acetylmuramic acid kinase